jgi:dihydrodipicolinate synthase/N-acetylneuraminate lyase
MHPKGIIAIPCTPYHADMTLDYDSLEREIEFILRSGAHGIAYPIMASEFYVLSDDERKKAVEMVIHAAGDSLPIYVGVTGQNIHHSLALAQHAQDSGATGLICMTPILHSLDEARSSEFFHLLDKKVSIPVMLQNVEAYGMLPLSIPAAIKIISQSENIKYIKEEGMPSLLRIEQAVRLGKDVVDGVYGGFGGAQFLDELELGVAGTLMACEFADIFAKMYNAWDDGDKEKATTIFSRLLPAVIAENKLFPAFPLAVLKKRGIIENSQPRSLSMELPERILQLVDRYIEDLDDLMI